MRGVYAFITVAVALLQTSAFAQRHTFDNLAVSVYDWRASGSRFQITLSLQNISDQRGRPQEIAIASWPEAPVAADSSGIQWLWEQRGATLPTGKNADDWVILRPGGSIPVTYMFERFLSSDHEPPFTFNHRFKLYNMDQRTPQIVPVFFGPLGQPRIYRKYPEPRSSSDGPLETRTAGVKNALNLGAGGANAATTLLRISPGLKQPNQGGSNSLSGDDCPNGYRMIARRWTCMH
ncbi:MAG: hypothetical protein V4706_17210 [Pseudomonadota bacterium]